MTTNRSSAELAMRDAIDAWGRARWPGARVVHELVTGECRVDMAFVLPDHIVGVELKSNRDVMTRLPAQLSAFTTYLPEVWLAVEPRHVEVFWHDEHGRPRIPSAVGHLLVEGGEAHEQIPSQHGGRTWSHSARRDPTLTVPLLHLIWADEARAIAARMRVCDVKREALCRLVPLLARKLTGDEIVREVCRELRQRDAFWRADAPMQGAAA